MLEKLAILGFQRHEKLILTFDPHITSIVGPNDKGKSSILRALLWVCCNDPSRGDEFINWNSKEASVRLYVDGHKISRTKSSNKNTYSLDGKVSNSFRSDVPEEIANLLNIGPLNFQHQHDPFFLLSDTAGQISRQLNGIIDMEVIDTVLSNTSHLVRTAKGMKQQYESQLRETTQEKAELDWIVEMNEELLDLEALQEQITQNVLECRNLTALLSEATTLTKTLENARIVDLETFSELEKTVLALQNNKTETDELETLISQMEDKERTCQAAKKELQILEKTLHKEMQGKCPICGATL